MALPPISVLQLEDSPLDASLATAALERAGISFRIERVERRTEFEAALEQKTFDLILADYFLPDFNGLQALEIAREKASGTPFIFVSGILGEEVAINSLHRGATDYVLKLRIDRLGPAVDRALTEVRERAEQRRIRSALAETESRFHNLAESLPVMIWTTDADTNWNYCNRQWSLFAGLSCAESSGLGWTALVHADDLPGMVDSYLRATRDHEELTSEFRMRRLDGEYRWIVMKIVPRMGGEKAFAGFIGSCTDVTGVKVAEERVRHALKLESLATLAGGVAHDFSNLLTGIMGSASLLVEVLADDSRRLPLAKEIVKSSQMAAQLTRQMLAYSGKGRFIVRELDCSAEIRRSLPLLEASLPKAISLHLDLADSLPLIEADFSQFEQLLINLVMNAAEASIDSGYDRILVATSVESISELTSSGLLAAFSVPPGSYVSLRVQDRGIGMDEETKSRIFDPFFTTKFVGRGLGLAAASGIIRGHKAGISLESYPGQGTDIRIYFPVSQASRMPLPSSELSEEQVTAPISGVNSGR